MDRRPVVEPGCLHDSPFGRAGACTSPLADGSGIGGRSTEAPAPPAARGRLGPGSQATEGSNLETYKLLRYDEDYSYLKDPSRRTDWLDVLKYIPLGDRDGYYLSLGGTARPRFEFNQNPFFGSAPANSHGNNNDLVQRYLLHADLHLGPNIRFFGQLQSGFENGLIGGPRRTSTVTSSTPIKRSSTSSGDGVKAIRIP